MPFPWPGKKDSLPGIKPEFPSTLEIDSGDAVTAQGEDPLKAVARDASLPSASVCPGSGSSDSLPALTERLETLGRLLNETRDQLTSYLLHRESRSGGDGAAQSLVSKIEALADRLQQGSATGIEQKLDNLKDALVPALSKLRDGQTEQHAAQAAALRQLSELVPQYFNALPQYFTAVQQQVLAGQQQADAGLRTIIDILRPPQSEPSAEPAAGGDWPQALLGSELAGNSALKADKNRLLGGVLSGDPGACGLVGALLQFRAAAADKMPPLLKDIGEAFYRWQPKSAGRPSEMEKVLAEWLMRACDQAGMANTIELVSPGERFDSLRHNAPRPGVEITQVLGWIVLRDNGKVYTKASVAVK